MCIFSDQIKEPYKIIPDTNGMYAITESGDVYSAKQKNIVKLSLSINRDGYKTVGLTITSDRKHCTIHRLLCSLFKEDYSDSLDVDHIDCNKLNNSLSNLRMVTDEQNHWNRRRTGKLIGIHYNKSSRGWQAAYKSKGRKIYIGNFKTPLKAAVNYDLAIIKARGMFATTNLVHIADRLWP